MAVQCDRSIGRILSQNALLKPFIDLSAIVLSMVLSTQVVMEVRVNPVEVSVMINSRKVTVLVNGQE